MCSRNVCLRAVETYATRTIYNEARWPSGIEASPIGKQLRPVEKHPVDQLPWASTPDHCWTQIEMDCTTLTTWRFVGSTMMAANGEPQMLLFKMIFINRWSNISSYFDLINVPNLIWNRATRLRRLRNMQTILNMPVAPDCRFPPVNLDRTLQAFRDKLFGGIWDFGLWPQMSPGELQSRLEDIYVYIELQVMLICIYLFMDVFRMQTAVRTTYMVF